MKIRFDDNASEEAPSGYRLLPEDVDLRWVITDVEERDSRAGNPMWVLTMHPIEPGGYGTDYERKFYLTFFLGDPEKQGYTIANLRALGFQVGKGVEFDTTAMMAQVKGKTLLGNTGKHRTFKKQDGSEGKSENIRIYPDLGQGKLGTKAAPALESEIPF